MMGIILFGRCKTDMAVSFLYVMLMASMWLPAVEPMQLSVGEALLHLCAQCLLLIQGLAL